MDLHDYDPKKKTPGRTRQARKRLALALGATLVLASLAYVFWPVVPAAAGVQGADSGAGTLKGANHQLGVAKNSEQRGLAGPRKAGLSERVANLATQYRGPGKSEVFPGFSNANRVLLATHNRLLWYRYDTDELKVIHEGQGVYYGSFPGEGRDALGAPTDLWVVSRPHNWRPHTTTEYLLHLDLETGEELGRVEIPSHFTHDAVRRRDKVYICSTGAGSILEYNFPSMELVREMELFSEKEHVNTLAPTPDNKLWVVLHNLGRSALALVDLASGNVVRRIEDVGEKSHGLVMWDKFALLLDSDGGGLLKVDLNTGERDTVWELGDTRFFMKGLSVVDDVAFFGIAPHRPRGNRADPTMECHLAAFDLKSNTLLWWRRLSTHGLLNLVSAPHLAVESTAYSINTANMISYRTKPDFAAVLERAKSTPLPPLADPGEQFAGHEGEEGQGRFPPHIGGSWSSGVPHMDLSGKTQGFRGGLQLDLFKADVAKLKEYVLSLPLSDWEAETQAVHNVHITGRDKNMNDFKPGVKAIILQFSDQDGSNVLRFPWYHKFRPVVEPILEQILGKDDLSKMIRVQLAYMAPHVQIKPHLDSGGYAKQAHRIHVVVATNPEVVFAQCRGGMQRLQPGRIDVAATTASILAERRGEAVDQHDCIPIRVNDEGLVFELNNRLHHYVVNGGETARIHMVLDVAERPQQVTELREGQPCSYQAGHIACT